MGWGSLTIEDKGGVIAMESIKEKIKKAVHSMSNFTDGLLNPEQATTFIKQLFENTILKDNARLVEMKTNKREIQKLGLGMRVTMLKEKASKDNARRATPSKVVMEAKSVTTPFAIDDELLDSNIEGRKLEQTIIDLMTKRAAVDHQEFVTESEAVGDTNPGPVVNNPSETGDKTQVGSSTAYVDTYLGARQGWIQMMETGTNIYDANDNPVSDDLLYQMIQRLPRRFKANRKELRFLCPPSIEMNYRKKTAALATTLGDQAKFSYIPLTPFGIPMVGCDALPDKFRKTEIVSISATAGTTTALSYKPIESSPAPVVVDENASTTLFVEDTDYTIDYVNGTITGITGSAILGSNVRITYYTRPRIILTHFRNLIYGVWRDIKIKKDEEIFSDVLLYAIHCSIGNAIEEKEAVVVAKNVKIE